MSNSTFSPSARDLNPSAWIAEWCTKQSFAPPSGVMKPKPFASLNHFTVPVVRAMIVLLKVLLCRRGTGTCRAHRPTVARDHPHDGNVLSNAVNCTQRRRIQKGPAMFCEGP